MMKSDERIQLFKEHLTIYRSTLNSEAIWLFAVILGCWSVTDELLRLCAIALATILFVVTTIQKSSVKGSYSKTFKEIERTIRDEFSDARDINSRLYELEELKKSTSLINFAKATPVFLLCYAYLIATIFHFIK